ncbi:MAG: hypothetical protein U9R00_03290 [Patescibacteria group bacterium]|nr:hypothetical protein [Patescibacteria group bacterium]
MKEEKNTTKVDFGKKHSKKKMTYKNIALYIILFVLVLGFFIGAYYYFNDSDKVIEKDYTIYEGFAFEKIGKFWQTVVEKDGNLYEVPSYTHPLDLEDKDYYYDDRITDFILKVRHSNLVLAVEPDAGSIPVMAGVNVAKITGSFYGLPTSSALYIPADERNESFNYSAPVVDCSDASIMSPIIYLDDKAEVEGVYSINEYPGCIVIGANVSENNQTILELSDLFVFKILRIMD